MSKTVTIYGASDDLLEVDGDIAGADEYGAYGGPVEGVLTAPDGDSLIIRAEFSKAGAPADWTLSVENTDTYPAWPIRFGERPDREGDPALIIEVPDGTVFKFDQEDEDEA
jgi:hypothetical protein